MVQYRLIGTGYYKNGCNISYKCIQLRGAYRKCFFLWVVCKRRQISIVDWDTVCTSVQCEAETKYRADRAIYAFLLHRVFVDLQRIYCSCVTQSQWRKSLLDSLHCCRRRRHEQLAYSTLRDLIVSLVLTFVTGSSVTSRCVRLCRD